MNESVVSQFAGLAETNTPAPTTAREYLSVLEEACSGLEATIANLENRLDFFLIDTETSKPSEATVIDSVGVESNLNYRLNKLTHYVKGLNRQADSIISRVQ